LSPRRDFIRLERSRVFPPIDEKQVWSIVCFFIHRAYRKQGIASALIESAVQFAKTHGAEAVESYPRVVTGAKMSPANLFPGTVPLFERFGFRQMAESKAQGRKFPRVVMRYELKQSATQ
jgi:GNAT superfamily N-acetyltransferase